MIATAIALFSNPNTKWLVFGLFLLVGCQNLDTAKFPQKWRLPKAENIDFYPVFTKDDLVILPISDSGRDGVAAINSINGNIEWFLEDTDSIFATLYYNHKSIHIKNQNWIIPHSSQTRSVNTVNGKLNWLDTTCVQGEPIIIKDTESCYRICYNDTRDSVFLRKYNINSGKKEDIIRQSINTGEYLFWKSPILSTRSNHPQISFAEIRYKPKSYTKNTIYTWNLLADTLMFNFSAYPDNKSGYGISKPVIPVDNDQLWVARNDVFLYNPASNTEIWRTTLPADMLTSRTYYTGDNILFPAEDEMLYSLDPTSGTIQWKQKIAGTPSRISMVDSLIFIIGGSDRQLHILNKKNGYKSKIIQSRHLQKGNITGFDRTMGTTKKSILLSTNNVWVNIPLDSILHLKYTVN